MTPEEMILKEIEKRGMTIMTVARRAGITYSRIQPSLRGRRELRADEYMSLCAVLDLDPRGYLKGEGTV